MSELPLATLSKRGLVPNHSYKNELNLHVNEVLYSCEKMDTKARFEKETKLNSENGPLVSFWFYDIQLKTSL